MTDNPLPTSILAEARRIAECSLKPGIGCDVLEGSIARALYAERQRAAGIVRDNQEVVGLKSNKRFLEPRSEGNLVGTAYATAILADDGRKG